MKPWIAILAVSLLSACSSTPSAPLPTLAQLPTTAATPTFENEGGSPPANTPTPGQPAGESVNVQMNGAVTGAFMQAALTFEVGSDYILLFEQPEAEDPVQLRLILAGNIEPGTYPIVPDNDFQRPADASVAARFDLGFLPEDLSGTLVLDSIGDENFSGALTLEAKDGRETVRVSGEFRNLHVAVIG
ncbi:MAG: hypothetical protein K8J31_14595 [Anaerolineae bacterium]|nr:hypothetical protein [Anaerolineae bacterium]